MVPASHDLVCVVEFEYEELSVHIVCAIVRGDVFERGIDAVLMEPWAVELRLKYFYNKRMETSILKMLEK